ncbi:MAG: ring-opening amidohydrolase [Methylobacterium sp.]
MPAPLARLHRIPAASPDDVAGLEALIRTGALDPAAIVAILGKTEGNGCVNDFTRGFATRALRDCLAAKIGAAAADRVLLVMSGGTEGALSPHWLVFERTQGSTDAAAGFDGGSLALGTTITRDLRPEEIGRGAQVETVRDGVFAAMRAAGIVDPADVHLVQIKCPLLTSARVADARARGHDTASADTLKSMGLSRGASALGVALALGEIEAPDEGRIGTDMSLYSARASTSAGIELMGHEILVLGMSTRWRGPLAVGHAVMRDVVDAAPVRALTERLGVGASAEVVALVAKAEASRTGLVRGSRHTMNEDSDLAATRHARAFVGGVLAGLVGTTELFVSGGAEHQGPDGGGPVAVIVRRRAGTGAP